MVQHTVARLKTVLSLKHSSTVVERTVGQESKKYLSLGSSRSNAGGSKGHPESKWPEMRLLFVVNQRETKRFAIGAGPAGGRSQGLAIL